MKNQNVDLVRRVLNSEISVAQRINEILKITSIPSTVEVLNKSKNETLKSKALVHLIVLGIVNDIGIDKILTDFIVEVESHLLKKKALLFVNNTHFLSEFALMTNDKELKSIAQKRSNDLDIKFNIFDAKIGGELKYGLIKEFKLKSTLIQVLFKKDTTPISNMIINKIFPLSFKRYDDESFFHEIIGELFYHPINMNIKVNIFNLSNKTYLFNSSPKEFIKLDKEFKETILPFISIYPEFVEEVAINDEDEEIRRLYIPFITRESEVKKAINKEVSAKNIKLAELTLETKELF